MDYLKETYGGYEKNSLIGRCYYCYTIHDKINNKYYSGFKTRHNTDKHGLLDSYFTSSSVIDFRNRLMNEPENFEYYIEYFNTAEDAAEAERFFHRKHNVGKNPKFYNAISSGGSVCGSGSVLCKDSSGNTYRVSLEEYSKGIHKHVSCEKMNVILKSTGEKIKINIRDYDESKHIKELEGMVHVYDLYDKKFKRIKKEDYINGNGRYVGTTLGKVSVYDMNNNLVQISTEEYKNNNHLYRHPNDGILTVKNKNGETVKVSSSIYNTNRNEFLHHNSGMIVVKDKETGVPVRIGKQEYLENKTKYENNASNNYPCFDSLTGERVNISIDEFKSNRERYKSLCEGKTVIIDLLTNTRYNVDIRDKNKYNWYAPSNSKVIFEYRNKIFASSSLLKDYIRKTSGKKISRNLTISNGGFEKWLHENGGRFIYMDALKCFGSFVEENFDYEN